MGTSIVHAKSSQGICAPALVGLQRLSWWKLLRGALSIGRHRSGVATWSNGRNPGSTWDGAKTLWIPGKFLATSTGERPISEPSTVCWGCTHSLWLTKHLKTAPYIHQNCGQARCVASRYLVSASKLPRRIDLTTVVFVGPGRQSWMFLVKYSSDFTGEWYFLTFWGQVNDTFWLFGVRWMILFTKWSKSRWWFHVFFMFTPIPGEMIQFDEYFSNGLVQPPTSGCLFFWIMHSQHDWSLTYFMKDWCLLLFRNHGKSKFLLMNVSNVCSWMIE